MQIFDSERAMEAWLAGRAIDTASWGSAGAKTTANLWHEYEQGEIIFRDHPPQRLVRVVRIMLRRNGYVLYEIAQELSDGRLRQRRQPPSEKIIAEESQAAAAERCLREELGLDPRHIHLLDSPAERTESVAESPSYPGLQTHYILFTIEATVDGLPEADFWRENEAAGAGDPVKRHLWGWRRTS